MADRSYLFGFLDSDGFLYDHYLADDLKESQTWDAIDFKFSLPNSKYLLIWKRNGKKLSKIEADHLTKYVRDDMKEFMCEPIMSDSSIIAGEEGTQTMIRKKLLPSKDCLILAYDTLDLPMWADDWNEVAEEIKPLIFERLEAPRYETLDDQAALDILSGKIPSNPYLESYRFRKIEYPKFELPSDRTLKQVYDQIKICNFTAAANYLAGAYQISPPIIDLRNKPPGEVFAFYDNPDSKIILSLDKIPEFWQQLPAFFLTFFKHLSQSKDWKFGDDYNMAPFVEKNEAEKFSQMLINRLLELGLDPRIS